MSALELPSGRAAAPWTCPFCPLLCDSFGVDTMASGWALTGSHCGRAGAALARFGSAVPAAAPQIDGVPCDMKAAVAAAARVLAASRQPLFGGLGTDVAGARALYPLASRTGAICDAASGPALWHGLLALQDRGAFTTTLAEVRTRADLIFCIGALPVARHPEFLRRCGVGEGSTAQVVVLQAAGDAAGEPSEPGVEVVPFDGDLFDVTAMLAAQVAGRAVGDAAGPLGALAARLHAARYAVLVYETVRLPAHGSLIVEAINRIVATLNQRTRAAALPMGGIDGASTVNAVFTWMSGLPLRTRASPAGLEHEPVRFDARRLLADRAVDALLWIASFGTEPAPPEVDMPRIVLGHPSFAAAAHGPATVFIPVSTPGIGSAGHLFRTDGVVLMPLSAVCDDGLPTVADVIGRITRELGA
ncbi:MAG: formylmethanofuran dehydrogenase [Burkholderiales bacterium]